MPKPRIQLSVDFENVNFALRQIYVGQGGTLPLAVSGMDTALFTCAAFFHPLVEGQSPSRVDLPLNEATGRFEADVPGWALSVPGTADYEVVFYTKDETPAPYWAGWGKVVIKPSVIDADIPEQPEGTFPAGYVQHPVTGLWHRIVGAINELGELTTTPEEEGSEHV